MRCVGKQQPEPRPASIALQGEWFNYATAVPYIIPKSHPGSLIIALGFVSPSHIPQRYEASGRQGTLDVIVTIYAAFNFGTAECLHESSRFCIYAVSRHAWSPQLCYLAG